MRRICLGSLAAVAALMLSACWQKSIEPFYTEKDLMYDPALIGSWVEPKEEPDEKVETWEFSQGPGEKHYLLKITDDDLNPEYEVRLFKLGEARFLDVFSRKRPLSEIPAHHLLKVEIKGGTLEMSAQRVSWIRDWIAKHPKSLAHIVLSNPENPGSDEGEIVLTAKTADLQKFLRKHIKDPEFFEKPVVLTRAKSAAK